MKMYSRGKVVGKKLDEGDSFSARARENSHFGGLTQSRSNSPAPSYVLAPSTTVVNWGDSKNSIHSASSSVIELPRSRNGSMASLPLVPLPAKTLSPLRLNPSDVPLSGKLTATDSVGGSYMPPLPSPRSIRSFTNSQANSNWVSPLDVHFSRPTTPKGPSSRPQSYLPRLQFPEEIGKSALLEPAPAGPVSVVNPESDSFVSINVPAAPKSPSPKSPTFNFNFFEPEIPTRPARQSTRSIFPATNDDERPVSRHSAKDFSTNTIPIPNVQVPQSYFGPLSPGLGPNQYGEQAVIRDSIVSKRSVSIYQPHLPHAGSTSTEYPKSNLQAHSRVASSVYSARTSVIETNSNSRSHSLSSDLKGRSRSRSTSSKRTSSHAISRTQDSIRRHSRKMSVTEKRRSRERDQIHYDPTSHHRNRSGSVQGRSVDFDRPRESPFSNVHAISKNTHSASSSISTTSTTSNGIPRQKADEPPVPKPPVLGAGLGPGLGLGVADSDRLSVMTGGSRRGRSASEASQSSMGFGDFYDAYYRQSVLAQRASVASQVLALNNNSVRGSGQDLHLLGVGVAVTGNGNAGTRRPAPLRLGGAGVGETIIEVASPMPSPMANGERYPTRI